MKNLIHPVEKNIALQFENVSFSYNNTMRVLEKASFHIHQGEFVALVGPNGSGKTTVLKLLLGLEKPSSGKIELFGAELFQGLPYLGYVPQNAVFDIAFPILVREVVKMGRLNPLSRKYKAQDKVAVENALQHVEIADLADRPYNSLSGGQRRRVLVARSLAAEPKFLILDEPTANMDSESENRLFKTLGKLKQNTTILIVTHDRDFVSSLIDRVLCMGTKECGEYGIVQHKIKEEDSRSRVIHEKSIPGDLCYESEGAQ